jgi:hypothetical protein
MWQCSLPAMQSANPICISRSRAAAKKTQQAENQEYIMQRKTM